MIEPASMRVGQVVRLVPERRDAHLELHRAVWPGVAAAIQRANIGNFSIFERDGLLLSYFEYSGSDFESDAAALAADETTQRWWDLTDPGQQPLPGHPGPRPWAPMTEIFHQD